MSSTIQDANINQRPITNRSETLDDTNTIANTAALIPIAMK